MPLKISESFQFGGVSSRDNPANFPVKRSLRCLNFEPQLNGKLQLRRGFSTPTMTGASSTATIHSAIYYELQAGTPQYVLYGQGNNIYRYRLSDGQVTNSGTVFTTTNPWGFFRANGKIFFADGVSGVLSYDGATFR